MSTVLRVMSIVIIMKVIVSKVIISIVVVSNIIKLFFCTICATRTVFPYGFDWGYAENELGLKVVIAHIEKKL